MPGRTLPHFCLGCFASAAPSVSPHQSRSASAPACQSFSEEQQFVTNFPQTLKYFTTGFSVNAVCDSTQKCVCTQNNSAPSKYLNPPVDPDFDRRRPPSVLSNDRIGPGTVSTRPTDLQIHLIDWTTLMLKGATFHMCHPLYL